MQEGLGIYTVEIYLKVRLAVSEGMTQRQAAKHFNISRDSVAKMLSYSTPPGYQRRSSIQRPKLDAFVSTIEHWLEEDLKVPRKQRHTAKRVLDRLRDERGFTGGYTIIKDYMRERDQRRQEVFVPLAHPLGNGQADFGEAMVVIGGVERKAHFFVLDLPHSDGCYVRAYPAAVSEAWVDGHIHAFAFFGAVPQSIVYDNDRCLVAKILPDGTRKRATLFSGFLSHYLIRDRYGRPGKGNDKGNVEGLVGYARRNFMVPIPQFATWEAFNAWLEEQCRKRQRDRLRGESETIGERLQRDLAVMRALPASPFDACDQAGVKVTAQSLERYKTNDYSVPVAYGHQDVWVRGLYRRGGDRLPRRDHRPPSEVLGTGRRRLRSGSLPAADRAEDQCAGSGCPSSGLGPAGRVRYAAPTDGRPHGKAWPAGNMCRSCACWKALSLWTCTRQ